MRGFLKSKESTAAARSDFYSCSNFLRMIHSDRLREQVSRPFRLFSFQKRRLTIHTPHTTFKHSPQPCFNRFLLSSLYRHASSTPKSVSSLRWNPDCVDRIYIPCVDKFHIFLSTVGFFFPRAVRVCRHPRCSISDVLCSFSASGCCAIMRL